MKLTAVLIITGALAVSAFPVCRAAAQDDLSPAEAADMLRTAGSESLERGDYDSAIINWNKAIALDPALSGEVSPELARVYAGRGAARQLKGDFNGAVSDLDEALRLAPDYAGARRARVLALRARAAAAMPVVAAEQGEEEAPPARSISPSRIGPDAAVAQAENRPAVISRKVRWIYSFLLVFLWCAIFFAGNAVTVERIEREPGLSAKKKKWKAVNGFIVAICVAQLVTFGMMLYFMAFGFSLSAIGAAFVHRGILPLAAFAVLGGFGYLFHKTGLRVPDPAGALSEPPPSQPSRPAIPAPSIRGHARALTAERKYVEALEILSKKPLEQFEMEDHNLFLEIYVRLGDFSRARLTLNQIIQELRARPETRCGYAGYLALSPLCREKGDAVLAYHLCKLAAERMLRTVSPVEAPQDMYSLAAELENEGDNETALKLYGAFISANFKYLDTAERYRDLKAKPAVPFEPQARKQPASKQSARASGRIFGMVLDGRYEIKSNLGEGAMGVVYEGVDQRTGRKVAVKQMHPWLKAYPEEYGRFKHEAEIVGRLKHPNIVGVNAITEKEGEIFLVFDFVDGRPLSDILYERKQLPFKECRDIFRGVCDAVHYAHTHNVIHRDLKLANIMLDSKGHAMVVDFGLASELRESLTRVTHQTMSGTPAYMAPEQYAGIVKRESDIYAMGVCLYEMLTGELPFQGADPLKQKKEKDYREVSSMLPWLPAGVDGLLAHALEPEPSQRIADAPAFYDAMKDL